MSTHTEPDPKPGDTVRFLVKHQFRFGVVEEIRGTRNPKALVAYGGKRRLIPVNQLKVRNPTNG